MPQQYLFIQSQDPFTHLRCHAQFDLARRLAEAGHAVRLLLVQNAVLAARQGTLFLAFDALPAAGVSISADSFSLRQREMTDDILKPGITPASLDVVITAMRHGDKVIWN